MLQGRIFISNMAKVSNNEVDTSYIPVNKKLSLQTAQIKVFPTVLPTITTIWFYFVIQQADTKKLSNVYWKFKDTRPVDVT